MTFKKNLFTLIMSVFLAVVGALLIGIETYEIVSGLTLVIPTIVLALLIEDLFRKLLGEREKLTWQYFLGELFVISSALAWFWASKSGTMKEMIVGLITVFLLGGCGILWFNLVYRASTQSGEEKEQAKWARFRTKIRASSQEEGYQILSCVLRYRLVDSNIASDLDLTTPLAPYADQFMTLEELIAAKDDGSGNYQIAKDSASDYILDLVKDLRIEEK